MRILSVTMAMLVVSPMIFAAEASPDSTHQVSFTNQCPDTVWIGEFGNGASASCSGSADCGGGECKDRACVQILCQSDSGCSEIQFCDNSACSSNNDCPAISCSTDADCPLGTCNMTSKLCSQTCDTSTGQCACTDSSPACPGAGSSCSKNRCSGGICRFRNLPSPGFWQLVAGGTTSIDIPDGWGGRFWARTGCPSDFATCKPAAAPCTESSDCCNNSCTGASDAKICEVGKAACSTGDCKSAASCAVSGNKPITLFEVNFTTSGVVWYDVSLVDSYSLPVKAVPVDSKKDPIASCETAGCTGPVDGSTLTSLAVSGTKACSAHSDCPSGNCHNDTCVDGYLAACDQCTNDPKTPGLSCPTNSQWYCCTNNLSCNGGSATCFNDDDCPTRAKGSCGADHVCTPPTATCKTNADCVTDYECNKNGACVPNATLAAKCCGPVNPTWLSAMDFYLPVFKSACPTGYSYQYDDPTSLFTCKNSGGVNYSVTFCSRN